MNCNKTISSSSSSSNFDQKPHLQFEMTQQQQNLTSYLTGTQFSTNGRNDLFNNSSLFSKLMLHSKPISFNHFIKPNYSCSNNSSSSNSSSPTNVFQSLIAANLLRNSSSFVPFNLNMTTASLEPINCFEQQQQQHVSKTKRFDYSRLAQECSKHNNETSYSKLDHIQLKQLHSQSLKKNLKRR